MKTFVAIALALALSGCCTSTWFRSCGNAQALTPAYYLGTPDLQAGVLRVTARGVPPGRYRIEARRNAPRGAEVLGTFEVTLVLHLEALEVEVWPAEGHAITADTYAAFVRRRG